MKVYLGIDWSERSHTAVFVDGKGEKLCQQTVAHSQDGFREMDQLRTGLGVAPSQCVVGLETAHNLVLDWLWGHGYTQVYIIPPNVTRSRQASYRQSGARSDESDGYLIGNLLRTDRHRLIPWQPDGELTQRLRAKVRLRTRLVADKRVHLNQLRQVLLRYYPAALEPFELSSYIALDFIQRYPTPAAAASLSYHEFERFAREHRYPTRSAAAAYARLKRSQPQALPVTVAAYQDEAVLLAQMLSQVKRHISQVEKAIADLFQQHPDASVFASLPGAGAHLAPALLVKFGDDRSRFPSAAAVQALAGTCPVTVQSGKRRSVHFRQACDHEFRTYAQQWAMASLKQSPWAVAYVDETQRRGHSYNRACRALANRWLAVAWKLWQTGHCYDQSHHLAQTLLFRENQH
jgi:transposase